MLPLEGMWVQSLVGELRSCMPYTTAKRKKKKKKMTLGSDCLGSHPVSSAGCVIQPWWLVSPSFSFLVYKIWIVTVLTIEIENNIYMLNSKQGECSTNGSHYYYCPKEMATHSSTLAWKIPWMEEPGRLQSMGSQRVGHN